MSHSSPWADFYQVCPACGESYHASEGGCACYYKDPRCRLCGGVPKEGRRTADGIFCFDCLGYSWTT